MTDTKAFRSTLGQFATGVAVVTAVTPDGERIGMTINSFTSVSLLPRLVSWSLRTDSALRPLFEAAPLFAVHVLVRDQEHLANKFARFSSEVLDQVNWQSGPDGLPLLTGCAARLVCKRHQVLPGGDHLILLGEVLEFESREAVDPLLFYKGRYASLTTRGADATA